MKKMAIGSDHRGYQLKENIKQHLYNDYDVKDFGCFTEESVDYPDIGKEVARSISEGLIERGILICGSGIGMSMTANRFRNVRAALCRNEKDAELSRRHNNSNVLVMGSDFIDEENAMKIIYKWIDTEFEAGRHERRINKIDIVSGNNKMIEVSASMLSKPEDMTMEALVEFISDLENSGIDLIHWDVMDGKYNSNNTWNYQGPDIIKSLREGTKLPFAAHLMIDNPMEKIGLFNDAGCNKIVFHYEACKNSDEIEETIKKIKSYGRIPGIAIEPDTPAEKLLPYLSEVGEVLVMTVRTGYPGQGFMDMTDKIRYLDKMGKEKDLYFQVAVDGGINDETGRLCRDAGADILVAASYIRKNNYKDAIRSLRGS